MVMTFSATEQRVYRNVSDVWTHVEKRLTLDVGSGASMTMSGLATVSEPVYSDVRVERAGKDATSSDKEKLIVSSFVTGIS
jgi:hypothetical protein